MRSLHTQSATVDLASGATVLSHTVTTATALADLILEVGDGTSNLGAAAETTLTVAITVAGVPVRGSDPTETVEVGRTRLRIPVDTFPVALGETVAVTLTSDQAGDTAVAVTATLRDASPLQPVTRGRQVKADADGLVELTSASTELVATATKTKVEEAGGTLATINTALTALAAKFSGITSVAHWLRAAFRSSTPDATALSEINDGDGTYAVATDSLEAQGAKTALLGTGSVTISAPVGTDGSISIIYQGDDYASGRALSFTFNSGSYNVTGATSLFEAKPVQGSSFSATGTMTDNGDGTATAVVPITSAQSDLLETGPVTWSLLNITSAGLRETVTKGSSPLERRKHG